MLEMDHLVVSGMTLEEACFHTESHLGISMQPGGRHQHFGTHNRLLGLGDGLYLEAISIDPSAPKPNVPRWFGLDHFRGEARLDKWVCRVPDMDKALSALPMAGTAVSLERGALRWKMAVPDDGKLPFDGLFPALIQWDDTVPPGKTLPRLGAGFLNLEVTHPDASELEKLLEPFFEDKRVTFVTDTTPGLKAGFEVHGEELGL